jgi:hypothetical protein
VPYQEVVLLVQGTLFEAKTESASRRKRGVSTIQEEARVSKDEEVLDIHVSGNSPGFRVLTTGFDFSCLGEEKELLAVNNIGRLAEKLNEAVGTGKLDNDYRRVREFLSLIWEFEEMRDSSGLKRSGLGKVDLLSTVTLNNRRQFTKYSRLSKHLL